MGTKSNPVLPLIREDHYVFMEMFGRYGEVPIRQIVRVYDLKYEPEDNQYDFNWLNFKGEVIYTNFRMHPEMINSPAGNCLSITEIIPIALLERFAANHNMWLATEFPLSDEELQAKSDELDRLLG